MMAEKLKEFRKERNERERGKKIRMSEKRK